MQIGSNTYNQSSEGRVIVKNKISKTHNHLFNLHRPNIEKQIENMPFDLIVEQSKNKKIISLTADVKNANSYVVYKNQQDFEKVAGFAIADGAKKSEAYQKLLKATEMFNHSKSVTTNIITGNFKEARIAEQNLAKAGIKDFETFKSIPKVSITNVPLQIWVPSLINSFKYKIYRAFSKKTPEEKQFNKMRKAYLQELKTEKKTVKTVEIKFPKY